MAAGVAFVACSGGSGSTTAGNTCSNYASALRDRSARCGTESASPEQEATAIAQLTALCTNALNAPGNGLPASAIDACANELRTTCDPVSGCDALRTATGTLPDGAACGSDAQCQGGECSKPSGSGGCGKCTQRIPIGGACTSGSACAYPSTCASKGTSRVCAEPLGEGEVCYDPKAPASSPADCAVGLRCNPSNNTSSPTTCAKRGGSGATCQSLIDCQDGLACVGGKCAPRLPNGSACTNTNECAAGACVNGKCTPYQFVAAGAACGNEKRCRRGKCSGLTTGVCIDPIAIGGSCSPETTRGAPSCEGYATCIDGKCQLEDPARCK